MKTLITFIIFLNFFPISSYAARGEGAPTSELEEAMFDDKVIFKGYVDKYKDKTKEVIVAMINDTTVGSFKLAAAIHILADKFADDAVGAEKNFFEKTLLRILSREISPFIQTETMSALVALDRYKYFKIMVPRLIEKLDHYNDAVVDVAYDDLTALIAKSTARTREARIIFNTLRKILFLSRKKLEYVQEPDEKLQKKLDLLFWSIKVLGTQELKQLPSEVIRLL
jgi:hypothetical protein